MKPGRAYESIVPTPEDRQFRSIVKDLIDSAVSEIIIIAGELGSYGFPELREAVHRARERNVTVRVYATERAPVEIRDDMQKIGCDLNIGVTPVRDHYLVIDEQSYVVSRKTQVGPTEVGTRHGGSYRRDPKAAKKIARFFDRLLVVDFITREKESDVFLRFCDEALRAYVPGYDRMLEDVL